MFTSVNYHLVNVLQCFLMSFNISQEKIYKMPQNIVDMLEDKKMTRVCGPMVRYSKLQFRSLVRKYDCDICFTPMILADSFIQSSKARDNEFTTNAEDKPLIVQFAANEANDFVQAAEMIAPYSDGVDLNCGCPQRWAMKQGYGANLLSKPQLIKDLVYQVRNRISKPFTVSVKIRILKDIKKVVEICQNLEKTEASFITVHARTPEMRNEQIDLESLKILRDSIKLPIVANGGVKNLKDAEFLYKQSQCNGVMAASGLLTNPALFSGNLTTPLSCIQDWLDITSTISTNFLTFHHHLVFMLEKILTKKKRRVFNIIQDRDSVLNFLEESFNLKPKIINDRYKKINCVYNFSPNISHNNVYLDEQLLDLALDNFFIT